MQRRTILLLVAAGLVTACAPQNSANYVPTAVERALTGSVYRGEWKSGFRYEITFRGVGQEMTANVFVIDSDKKRTEYRMPARVTVAGSRVTLRYTKFDRQDYLTFTPDSARLDGYIVFKGKKTHKSVWAEKT